MDIHRVQSSNDPKRKKGHLPDLLPPAIALRPLRRPPRRRRPRRPDLRDQGAADQRAPGPRRRRRRRRQCQCQYIVTIK